MRSTGLAHIPIKQFSFSQARIQWNVVWGLMFNTRRRNHSNINYSLISNIDSLIGHDLAEHLSKCLNPIDLSGI